MTTTPHNPADYIHPDLREWTTPVRPADWNHEEWADYELVLRVIHSCQGDPDICAANCELLIGSMQIGGEDPGPRNGTCGGIKVSRIPELIAVLQDYARYSADDTDLTDTTTGDTSQ